MDIFSPSLCSESAFYEGTNNEQHAWFYKRILELNTHLTALDTSLGKASQLIGDNSARIDANKQTITEIKTKLNTLANNFTDLSVDNTAFKEQMNASFSELTKLVSGYNASVNKLETTTTSNTTRITNLENTVDPNKLNAILAKVNGLDAAITSMVNAKVDSAIGSVKGDLNTTISTQNKNIDGCNALATQANTVASQALSTANNAVGSVNSLNTAMSKSLNDLDTKTAKNLTQERTDRQTNIDNVNLTLSKKISAISTGLVESNTSLTSNINDEIKNRSAAITALTSALNTQNTENQVKFGDINASIKAVNGRVDTGDNNLISERKSRVDNDNILDGKISALTNTVDTNLTNYKKDKEALDNTDINLQRAINTENSRAIAAEKVITDTATQDRSNTTQNFDTLAQSIIDWSLGTGEDYHLKTDAVKGSVGNGLKGQFDGVKSELKGLSLKVNEFTQKGEFRLSTFDGRLTQDEAEIAKLHLKDDAQDALISTNKAAIAVLQEVDKKQNINIDVLNGWRSTMPVYEVFENVETVIFDGITLSAKLNSNGHMGISIASDEGGEYLSEATSGRISKPTNIGYTYNTTKEFCVSITSVRGNQIFAYVKKGVMGIVRTTKYV